MRESLKRQLWLTVIIVSEVGLGYYETWYMKHWWNFSLAYLQAVKEFFHQLWDNKSVKCLRDSHMLISIQISTCCNTLYFTNNIRYQVISFGTSRRYLNLGFCRMYSGALTLAFLCLCLRIGFSSKYKPWKTKKKKWSQFSFLTSTISYETFH